MSFNNLESDISLEKPDKHLERVSKVVFENSLGAGKSLIGAMNAACRNFHAHSGLLNTTNSSGPWILKLTGGQPRTLANVAMVVALLKLAWM